MLPEIWSTVLRFLGNYFGFVCSAYAFQLWMSCQRKRSNVALIGSIAAHCEKCLKNRCSFLTHTHNTHSKIKYVAFFQSFLLDEASYLTELNFFFFFFAHKLLLLLLILLIIRDTTFSSSFFVSHFEKVISNVILLFIKFMCRKIKLSFKFVAV